METDSLPSGRRVYHLLKDDATFEKHADGYVRVRIGCNTVLLDAVAWAEIVRAMSGREAVPENPHLPQDYKERLEKL